MRLFTGEPMFIRSVSSVAVHDHHHQRATTEDGSDLPKQKTLHDKMDDAIKLAVNNELAEGHLDYNRLDILQEMKVYEATGKRTPNLELLYQALKSIPPNSVEAERAFSATGLFVSKLRTRLTDRSIDHMCFLKSFFKSSG